MLRIRTQFYYDDFLFLGFGCGSHRPVKCQRCPLSESHVDDFRAALDFDAKEKFCGW